jgi:cell division protein ZapA
MESIQVEIFGQMYTLKGGLDPDRVRELAAYVNARMKEVQKGTGVSDGYRVAILAALNIADELHRVKGQQDTLQKTATQTVGRLLELTQGTE